MSRRVPRDRVVGRDGSVDPNAAQRRLDATADVVDEVASRVMVQSVLIPDVPLGVGANHVKTGLDRPARFVSVVWKGSASLGSVTRDHRNERRPDSEIRLIVRDDKPYWELVGTVTCATASDIVAFQNLDGRVDREYRWTIALSMSSTANTNLNLSKNTEGTTGVWRWRMVQSSPSGVNGGSSSAAILHTHASGTEPERVWIVGEMQADDRQPLQAYIGQSISANLGTAGEMTPQYRTYGAVAHTGSQVTALKFYTVTAGMILPGSTFNLYRRALPTSGSALADILVS